jgi:ABC-type dipeptide/oligopeptide/nickel transport system permease subunit
MNAAGARPVGARALVRRLRRHGLATAGFVVIVVVTAMALFAPVLASHDPYQQNLRRVLQPPSSAHWLGTDNVGRDLFSRVIYGARVSLLVGFSATLFSAVAGVVIGLVAGYLGGVVDSVLMRVTDAFMCFPYLIFVLALAAALGPGVTNIVIAFAVLGWTGFARIVRGEVLLLRELPYIEAARAAGVGEWRLMFRHVLPNALAPVIVATSITVGLAILTESGTAFLGLGAEPPTASWGKELRIGYTYLERVPLFSLAPGLMITLTVLAFNFLGDGLRDALDPRLRGESAA